jgi:hypothetical protein
MLMVALPALVACGVLDLAGPQTSAREGEIEQFVQQQLSKVLGVDTLMHVPEHDVVLFTVTYGDPVPATMPCIGTCPPAYPRAWGLKYSRKIGWLSGMFSHPDRYRFFEVDAGDQYLFTGEFFSAMGAAEPVLLEQTFKPMLVRNTATPLPTLQILGEGLYTWINPPLAELLLEDPRVRASRDILVLIANLPVFQGDAYRYVRVEAQQMLRQFPS